MPRSGRHRSALGDEPAAVLLGDEPTAVLLDEFAGMTDRGGHRRPLPSRRGSAMRP
ncbi:hypothetical protein [Streptomyces mirabilis]|uniref:hypothetical protein n=1 Tax=Streptomyces mirabilis TaxID=68239 RepID=UPI0032564089